jgi:hypothetical protein
MAHEEVVQHHSGLARATLTGETVVDCTAGYNDTSGLPGGAPKSCFVDQVRSQMARAAKVTVPRKM